MDSMQRVLDERSEEFAQALTGVGFTRSEADRFVAEAGSALLRSCEWQERSVAAESRPARPYAARELLSTISGRRLASRVGLPEDKTWLGLREFVPAVLQASRPTRGARIGAGAGVHLDAHERRARFDVGFGLTLEGLGSPLDGTPQTPSGRRRGVGSRHPIFRHLLPRE